MMVRAIVALAVFLAATPGVLPVGTSLCAHAGFVLFGVHGAHHHHDTSCERDHHAHHDHDHGPCDGAPEEAPDEPCDHKDVLLSITAIPGASDQVVMDAGAPCALPVVSTVAWRGPRTTRIAPAAVRHRPPPRVGCVVLRT